MGVLNVLDRVLGVVRYSGRGIKQLCEVVAGCRVHVQKKGSLYPSNNRTMAAK